MSEVTADKGRSATVDETEILPYLTGRQVSMRTDEVFKILNNVDLSQCCQDMPHCPKGGNVYIYRPRSEESKEDWRSDGYTWKNQGTSSLPRDKPKLRKRYFYALNPDGSSNLEFRKDAFSRLDVEDENTLTLVHYIGDSEEASVAGVQTSEACTVSGETTEPLRDLHLCTVEETQVGAGDQDLDAIQNVLQAGETSGSAGVTDSEDKLKDAMETVKAALSDKKPDSPVVQMFNQLLTRVYSEEKKSDVEYCLVMSNPKSGKKSFIGSDKVREDLLNKEAGSSKVGTSARSKRWKEASKHDQENKKSNNPTPSGSKSRRKRTRSQDTDEEQEEIQQDVVKGKIVRKSTSGSSETKSGFIESPRASGRLTRKVDSPNWREILSGRKQLNVTEPGQSKIEKSSTSKDINKRKDGNNKTPVKETKTKSKTVEREEEEEEEENAEKEDNKKESQNKVKSSSQKRDEMQTPRGRGRPPGKVKKGSTESALEEGGNKRADEERPKRPGTPTSASDVGNGGNSSTVKGLSETVAAKQAGEKIQSTNEQSTPSWKGKRKVVIVKKLSTEEKECVTEIESSENNDASKALSISKSAGKIIQQMPRGRGRPKKVLATTKDETVEIERSRNSVASEEDGEDKEGEAEKDNAKPGPSSEVTPARGRGRPKGSLNKTKTPVCKSTPQDVMKTHQRKGRPKGTSLKKYEWVEISDDEDKDVSSNHQASLDLGSKVDSSSGRRSSSRQTSKHECVVCNKRFIVEYLLEEHMKTHPKSELAKFTVVDQPVPLKEERRGRKRKGTESGEKKKVVKKERTTDNEESEDEMDVDEELLENFSDDDPTWSDPDKEKVVKKNKIKQEKKLMSIEDEVRVIKKRGRKKKIRDSDQPKPTCRECGKTFESEAGFKEHRLSHIESVVSCPYCKKYFESEEYVLSHIQSTHPDIDLDTDPVDFTDRYFNVMELEQLDTELEMEVVVGLGDEKIKSKGAVQAKAEGQAEETSEESQGIKRTEKFKCEFCDLEFNMDFSCRRHKAIDHEMESDALLNPNHQCPVCRRSFKSELSLMIHKVIHTQGETEEIICEVCSQQFSTKGELRTHRRDEHDLSYGTYLYFGFITNKEGKIVCEICSVAFPSIDEYHEHRGTHLVYKYNCQFCGHGFHEEVKYTSHVASKCTENEPHLHCGVCDMKFSHYDTRRKHIKSVHNKKATEFTCHQCALGLESMLDLRLHLATHDKEKIFKCEYCDKGFLEKRNLISHRDLHRGSKDHHCSECGRKYFSRKGLQRHMHAHFGQQKYECRFCGKKFIYSDERAMHERIHGQKGDGKQDKDFVCKICGKEFLLFNRLKRHLQVHNAERLFECEICNKKFQTSSTLRTHRIVRHVDVLDLPNLKKLICEICGYVTYQKPRLRRHMQIHNTNKEFGCEECGKKFQTSSSLNSHKHIHRPKRRLAPNELLPCTWENCKKVFQKKVGLRRHLMSHVWRVKKGRDKCNCTDCQLERNESLHQSNILPHLQQVQGEVVLSRDSVSALISEGREIEVSTEAGVQTVQQLVADGVEDQVEEAMSEIAVQMEEDKVDFQGTVESSVKQNIREESVEDPAVAQEGEMLEEPVTQGQQNAETGQQKQGPEEMNLRAKESQIARSNVTEEGATNENKINEKKYDCPKCYLSFSSACQVVTHVITHKNTKYPTCEVCGKSYLEKRNLIEHMSIHSGERPFECETCGKRFRTRASWRQHCFIHAKIKPYICNYCGHGFTQKGFFDEHLRRHTGERPFSCQVCKRGFVSKDLLRRHMYSHTGNKPHQCNLCGKSFIENMQLVVHMRTHNDDRPYKCTKCDKAFFVNSKLQRHLTTVHKLDRQKVSNYVPTRINQGIGWRHKSKMKDFPKGTNVVYLDQHGQIVTEFKAAEDIKQEQEYDSYEEIDESQEPDRESTLPPGPVEVRTRRDSSGHIQIVAKALPSEKSVTVLQHASNAVLANPGGVIQVKSTSGDYTVSNYIQTPAAMASQSGDNHIELITQALAGAQAHLEGDAQGHIEVISQEDSGEGHIEVITQDGTGDGHIEVITEEVTTGDIAADSESNIEIYTQSDISQLTGESENFSINIAEDGTVDVADFEKIEALRHLYGSGNSDEPIVIVLESQQQ